MLQQEKKILYENLSKTAVKNFGRRHILAQYVPTREEAIPKILELIPEGVSVGTGDSETLKEIGILEAIRERGQNEVLYPFLRDEQGNALVPREKTHDLMVQASMSRVFISSANAITLDGKIVNVDGGGNRVAPIVFGPEKVIIVVGANKIVKNQEEALNRLKELCAPMNALRHSLQHHDVEFLELPCAATGTCADCYKPQRMCNFTLIIEGESHWNPGRMQIVIIGESLGI